MKKKRTRIIAYLTLSALALAIYIAFKPPEPQYFRENPNLFSYSYTFSQASFKKAVEAIIHEEMSISDVNSVFSERAGAEHLIFLDPNGERRHFFRRKALSASLNCLLLSKNGPASWAFEVRASNEGNLKKFKRLGGNETLVEFVAPCT